MRAVRKLRRDEEQRVIAIVHDDTTFAARRKEDLSLKAAERRGQITQLGMLSKCQLLHLRSPYIDQASSVVTIDFFLVRPFCGRPVVDSWPRSDFLLSGGMPSETEPLNI